MPERSEEEPDDPAEAPAAEATATSATLPQVDSTDRREFEYQTIQLSQGELTDGKTLAERLTSGSRDGWDLADIVPLKDQVTVLLRRPKRTERSGRPVGFLAPRN